MIFHVVVAVVEAVAGGGGAERVTDTDAGSDAGGVEVEKGW